MEERLENMDYFRNQPEGLGIPQNDKLDVATGGEQIPTSVPAVDASNDSAEKQREEEIELWMNNIKEFIRSIDVKAL